MSYKHFGRIGDIWKHLPLAEFLVIEKPRKYVETNSASSIYKLSNTPEQQYGVYNFYYKANKMKYLKKSEYYKILKYYNKKQISVYPGSTIISYNALKDLSTKFILFDIEKESLDEIKSFMKDSKYDMNCFFNNKDSIIGTMEILDKLDNNDFIHFDPYEAFLTKSNGYTYFDVFLEATKRGIKCMLWYGYMTLEDKYRINKLTKKKIEREQLNDKIYGIEAYLKIIQKNTVISNPGIIGSGIYTSNLSNKSLEYFKIFSYEITKIYKNTKLFDSYDGEIVMDRFEY